MNPNDDPFIKFNTSQKRKLTEGQNYIVSFFLAILTCIFLVGPLATGIGFIFFTFLQAIGIGMVSCVLALVPLTIFISKCQ